MTITVIVLAIQLGVFPSNLLTGELLWLKSSTNHYVCFIYKTKRAGELCSGSCLCATRLSHRGSGIQVSNKLNVSFSTRKDLCAEPLWPWSSVSGLEFECCFCRPMSPDSSHHPQEVLLAQFILFVHQVNITPCLFIHANSKLSGDQSVFSLFLQELGKVLSRQLPRKLIILEVPPLPGHDEYD